jgi:magnesium transporter
MKWPHHTKDKPLRYEQPGLPPGTLKVDPDWPEPKITVIAYDKHDTIEETLDDLSTLGDYLEKWTVVWVNVDGLGSVETLESLARQFHLHPLAMEDVVSLSQRPKVDAYSDQLFLITRMVNFNDRLETEQLSLILMPGLVLTFQERQGDCLDIIRRRIRMDHGVIRTARADYLAYALLDAVVDHFFPVLEDIGERIAELENQAMDSDIALDENSLIHKIHNIKRDLRNLRRAIWPQREAVNLLMRENYDLIESETQLYLRDCYDHVTRIIDTTENNREMVSDLLGIYHSRVGNRMNAIMKVLTIFAAIFIPLTFIAGVYGMNFDPEVSPWNMPELRTRYGYPITLGVMAAMAGTMLIYFRKKRWL